MYLLRKMFMRKIEFYVICFKFLQMLLHFPYISLTVSWVAQGKINSNKKDLLQSQARILFEYDFEISWSLGPLDLQSLGPLNSWTFNFLTSSLHHQFLLLLPTSFLMVWFDLVWYGMVWYGEGGCKMTSEFIYVCEEISM